MELIGKVENTDDVEPMTFPFIQETCGLRDDEPGEVLSQEDVLKNASEVADNMVKINKVV